jgi:exportin-1
VEAFLVLLRKTYKKRNLILISYTMSASASMEEVAARLAKDFDLALLDQMIVAAYDPVNPNRSAANRALMKLQESPDLWTKADRIIEESSNPQTRFFGLQVLIEFIKTR